MDSSFTLQTVVWLPQSTSQYQENRALAINCVSLFLTGGAGKYQQVTVLEQTVIHFLLYRNPAVITRAYQSLER
jgi:hypothetical protein